MTMRALGIAVLMMLAGAGASFAANEYSIPVGATVTIDEHGQCRQVTNPAGQPGSRFVSTRTAPEWQSVIDNPNALTLAECAGGGCPETPTHGSCTGGTILFSSQGGSGWAGCSQHCITNYPTTNCVSFVVRNRPGGNNEPTPYCTCYTGATPTGSPNDLYAPGYCGQYGYVGAICSNVAAACGGSAPPPADCSGPWGTVAHGASIAAFQAASVPHGSSCASEARTCTNGTLSGSYTHQTCNVQPPPAGSVWTFPDPQNSCYLANFFGNNVPGPDYPCANNACNYPSEYPPMPCSVIGQKCRFDIEGEVGETVSFNVTCQ